MGGHLRQKSISGSMISSQPCLGWRNKQRRDDEHQTTKRSNGAVLPVACGVFTPTATGAASLWWLTAGGWGRGLLLDGDDEVAGVVDLKGASIFNDNNFFEVAVIGYSYRDDNDGVIEVNKASSPRRSCGVFR
ncbi:hypothetical protein L6452_09109 [Arctium lappa]|uniref:Uncharacterized protein n=1 Tax=Arctium lappa TaxID=4217 RepID=A0ACB9DJG5_ARCLA|nr:hypothetical protein L6452_09109 [Arctium lappa]